MGIRDFFNRIKQKNERLKDLEIEDRALNQLESKKKTANERELERYYEEKRQEQIGNALNKIRKQHSDSYWHTDVITQKPLFKDKTSVMHGQSQILKQKNLFRSKA